MCSRHTGKKNLQLTTLNGEKLKSFPLRIEHDKRCPLSSLLSNAVSEVLAMALWTKKEIKGIQIGKKDVKLSLFADYMVISVLLLLRLLNCFSHVQLFVTPGTVAHQAPLSAEFSRQ